MLCGIIVNVEEGASLPQYMCAGPAEFENSSLEFCLQDDNC